MRLLLVPWYCASGFTLRIYELGKNGEIAGNYLNSYEAQFTTHTGHMIAARLLDKYGRKKNIAVFNSGRYFRVAVELNMPEEVFETLRKLSKNEKLISKKKKDVEKLLEKTTVRRLKHLLAIEKLVG